MSDPDPVLVNDTRWFSAYHMIESFTDLRDDLTSVGEPAKSDLLFDTRPYFKFQEHH